MDRSNTIFTAIPKFENLCCIRCIFSKHQIDHEIFANVKHCQVICCRDIIKTFPGVLASPVPRTLNYAYIVMSKEFYQTKKLQQYLDYRIINHTSLQKLTVKIFKLCVKYTITFHLMPNWNKCHEFLSTGLDFRNPTDELDAVKLDVTVEDEEMILKITPARIKIYPLNLKTDKASEKLHQREIAFILPSFHKCKLLEVSKNIPQGSQFKSYDVFRDHWKHMYGIRLPRNPKNINYYLVSSSESENSILVHPHFCLQTSLPTTVKCNNKSEIRNKFFNDLKANVTQICDKPVSFNFQISENCANSSKSMKIDQSPNSSLVKNPCFNSNFTTTKAFNCDPKNLKSLLFQMNVNSPTKSLSSHCSSFSFQNTFQSSINSSKPPEFSGTYSKQDFVKNWLLNSCSSQVSSLDTDSPTSKEDVEKLKDSPLETKPIFNEMKKPFVRSIERVNFPLLELKRRKH
ncbi:uncharacterized protein C18orf63-like [Leptopilina heterotoma]|uniref:uncharacterized protein C18orf63-like n=1 Tax=Leptopilina heterotoma TaxID=63436 RepID=UPI001CA9BD6E|nr:uncharacterized protein C18orf63-like [Leptopilina heterotoma]